MKIPVVQELISRMAERRPHIQRLLFSSIVNFLYRTRFVHLDIDFYVKLFLLGRRLFMPAFAFNFVHNQMNSFHVAELELRYIARLRPLELVCFIYNLVMILVDERILPRFFKLMKSVIINNKADSRFSRNKTSLILHLFFSLFITKI